MQVREWMSEQPVTVTPRTSVLEARRLLRARHVRHLPVVEGATVVGMLSDRDLVLGDRQVAKALSAFQSELVDGRYRSVETVMTVPAHVVRADAPIGVAAVRMQALRISALPVVEQGRLVGIITTTDCLRALQAAGASGPGHAPATDRDVDLGDTRVPMPPGDERPGRPVMSAAAASPWTPQVVKAATLRG